MASSDEGSVNKHVRQTPQDATGVLGPIRSGKPPGGRPGTPRNIPWLRSLGQTIQRDIIPRLVLAHAGPPVLVVTRDTDRQVSDLEFDECIASAALHAALQNEQEVRNCLDRAFVWGVPVEQIYVRILGGAAGALGRRWDDDTLDFVGVTIGMGVLQASMRAFAHDHQHEAAGLASARRILLLPTPGERHSFGTSVVAEVFRHRGWNVDADFSAGVTDINALMRSEWFDVVGLSLGSERNLHRLSETIRQIRRHSRNRRIGILVGGPAFASHPERLTCCGGDASSSDACNAVEQATLLIALLADGRG